MGKLYETDLRLRPSGLIVSSLSAFRDYQFKNAWIWGYQTLVRARVVAGCLAEKFMVLRKEILVQPRDQQSLLEEAAAMGQKNTVTYCQWERKLLKTLSLTSNRGKVHC